MRPCDVRPFPLTHITTPQAEKFLLPYNFLPLSATRPVITGTSATVVAMGATLTATYTGTVTYAVIARAPAVTHQVRPCGLGWGPADRAGWGSGGADWADRVCR